MSSTLIYLSISNLLNLSTSGLCDVLSQHFLPKNIQHLFLIDLLKSGVIIMVEYDIIVSTGTNYTIQLVLFSYSKPTPFNNLQSHFATANIFYYIFKVIICHLKHFLKSQVGTSSLFHYF